MLLRNHNCSWIANFIASISLLAALAVMEAWRKYLVWNAAMKSVAMVNFLIRSVKNFKCFWFNNFKDINYVNHPPCFWCTLWLSENNLTFDSRKFTCKIHLSKLSKIFVVSSLKNIKGQCSFTKILCFFEFQ